MSTELILGDCLEKMKDIPDKSIDMVLTSPPYDNLRTYKGYTFNFEGIAKEIYRVLKDGGVCVWIVGDATIKGSETGTSFKQALYFKEIGFNLHDTMIWRKTNPMPQTKVGRRYTLAMEYMFVFSKGMIKTFNPIMEKTKSFGRTLPPTTQRNADGTKSQTRIIAQIGKEVKEYKQLSNIWDISTDKKDIGHPAIFPEKLAEDHILSWSNEGDTILDPMMGSGTTGKMSKLNNRNFIGIEIAEEYIRIAKERIENTIVI